MLSSERTEILSFLEQEAESEKRGTLHVWPNPPSPEAFYGLPGEVVQAIEPHSEASPVALLVQTLVAFGNAVGRGPHFLVEADRHAANLFVVIVGATSKGRKGTSLSQVRRLLQATDPVWESEHIKSGLSSGEGLIWAVRDPIEKQEPIKEKGRVTDYQTVITDPGVEDKRLLVIESEFASPLRMIGRDGNTLSPVIRRAWDSGDLRVLTKNSPARATNAHISIIGHITRDELIRYLSSTEAGNGFGNRFLWICARRSKVLPEGGNLDPRALSPILQRLREAIAFCALSWGDAAQ